MTSDHIHISDDRNICKICKAAICGTLSPVAMMCTLTAGHADSHQNQWLKVIWPQEQEAPHGA